MITGLEPFLIDIAEKSIAGIVVKTAWDGGGKFLSFFGQGVNENTQKLIYNASKQYVENYSKRRRTIFNGNRGTRSRKINLFTEDGVRSIKRKKRQL
ncbi:hypothetical protein [Crocosphaera sp. XPORK-15E]|uniref:hypothetical protein n=1 Tax=Crocosphaera sp. XPORK-15E TaxID=3110247 RepID=UPI002B21104B|nr:hypothetical protein [Crocosphaera sp. XPORK-15E]MEA5535829.1 hypothetical protein [Crocosphaera sp. XPORK-15E]